MKNWKLPLYLSAMVFAISSVIPFNEAQAQGYYNNQAYYGNEVSLDMFYNELSPYGQWDYDQTYGDVWYPNEGRNFRPYSTNGYWTMTEYGNTWVSNYNWGWAPFHYGRWVYNNYRGWGWIPGYEWGPAWVDWRSGNGYYGWAPMMPSGIHISINLPITAWIFAPMRHLYSTSINRYASFGQTNIYNRTTIINNTYIVNNNRYYGGPSRQEIERNLGRRVEVRNIRVADRPTATRVDRNSVSIYRPNNNTSNRQSTLSRDNNGRIVSTNANRREQNTATSRTNNTATGRTASSANRTSTNATREMHIDKNGNATIRERNTNTSPASSRGRENAQRTNTAESRMNTTPRNNTSSEVRTQAPKQERTATQRTVSPQVQERTRVQQRESQVQRTPQVEQRQRAHTVSQANAGRRQSAPREVSMSRNTSSRSSQVGTASSNRSRGGQQTHTEHSRR